MFLRLWLRSAIVFLASNNTKFNIVYKYYYLRHYFREIGYFKSFTMKEPVDVNGLPIPWYTYSAIDFLTQRIGHKKNNYKIFEYGAGNSTIWWSKRVKKVHSVEHEKNWIKKLNSNNDNLNIDFCELDYDGEYCRFIQRFKHPFDIIVIDGRDRVNCIFQSFKHLTNHGIIILDNSRREKYIKGINFLINKGFKHIEFNGINPLVAMPSNTSIFYKNDNLLGL
jgi:precorrin-6B methylase 2